MGFRYHVQALTKDVTDGDSVFGSANVAVVEAALEKRKLEGFSDPDLERTVQELRAYFGHGKAGLTKDELELSRRQNVEGEILSPAEGEILEKAQKRAAKAARLSKAEAKKRAKLIQDRTRGWPD